MTDTRTTALQLHIAGDIQPQRLKSHELSEIISAYESALAAVVSRLHPTLKAKDVTVGLIGIGDGSVVLAFDAPLREYVYPAALVLNRAIAAEDWAELPLRAVKSIRKIVQFLKQKEWAAQFHAVYATETTAETADAVISGATNIPPALTLYGQTEIVAEVKWVGGQAPQALLETLQGETLQCETTAEIARQLGSHLYQQVKISGAAAWDLATLALVEFEIAAVLPYHPVAPAKAFAALREQFHTYFDQIEDPNEWADQTRKG